MKKLIMLVAFVVASLAAGPSFAQEAQKCEGPADLCAQVSELQQKLSAQKAASDAQASEKTEEQKLSQKKTEMKAAEMVAIAATIAVVLKFLLSALKGWKSYFHTDKGKAWLKVITLLVGFAAFILTNIGLGIPWWQAMIVAGGGPGSILAHEFMKLIPVLEGKAPMPEDDEEKDVVKTETKTVETKVEVKVEKIDPSAKESPAAEPSKDAEPEGPGKA